MKESCDHSQPWLSLNELNSLEAHLTKKRVAGLSLRLRNLILPLLILATALHGGILFRGFFAGEKSAAAICQSHDDIILKRIHQLRASLPGEARLDRISLDPDSRMTLELTFGRRHTEKVVPAMAMIGFRSSQPTGAENSNAAKEDSLISMCFLEKDHEE